MTPTKTRPHKPMLAEWTSEILSLSLFLPSKGQAGFREDFRTTDQLFIIRTILQQAKEGKESLQHPWQPTRLNGWNSVCLLLHSLCSTSCTNQTEEPCEPPGRYSTNDTSQAIIAGQGSVYAHNHCHKEQSSTQQDKPPSGRALGVLQVRPPADCVLQKGPLDKTH